MKKTLVALAALNAMAFAQLSGTPVDGVSVSVEDLTSGYPNMTELKIVVDNQLSEKKTVRANYVLPYITSGRYRLDRAYGINCPTAAVNSIPGVTYNLKKNVYSSYVLDVQMDVAPMSQKEICVAISKNDLSDYKNVSRVTQDYFTYEIDADGSPLDNPVLYNYVERAAYAKRDVSGLSDYSPVPAGEDFTAYVISDGANPGADDKKPRWNTENVASIPARNLVELGVKSYGAYKDTRMLVSAVGPFVNDYRWNESTFDGHMHAHSEERSIFMGRCWLIAVFNVYSYHYGNRNTKRDALAQDEMLYYGKMIETSNPQLGMFTPNLSEGGNMETTAALISRFLKDSNAKKYTSASEPLSGAKILEALESGTAIPFSITGVAGDDEVLPISDSYGHAMVIDGIAVDKNNKDTLVHIINVDNFGGERYVYLNMLRKFNNFYVLYDMPTSFEKTNALYPVDKDTDGDGIVDFDEHFRFMSDPELADTDKDGIGDMEEIYSYVVRANVIPNGEFHSPTNEYRFSVEYPIVLDYKNPESFPQNNANFDGDSKDDGEEDSNKNGIYEPSLGETDPLNKETAAEIAEIPSELTFFAKTQVALNEDIFCQNVGANGVPGVPMTDAEKEDFAMTCVVASAAENATSDAVIVGANTRLAQVHTKGSVELKQNAVVFATYVYNSDAQVTREVGSAPAFHEVRYDATRWNFNSSVKMTEVDFGDKVVIVEDGETFEVNDGDKYADVTVKEGGTLLLTDGEMFIGKLNMAYGSTFNVQNKNYATILHLNGQSYFYGENARLATGRDMDRYRAAASFKVYQHSEETIHVDNAWLGTIIAPNGRVAFGKNRGCKIIAGQFYADVIQVRYTTDVYHVAFAPVEKPAVTTPEEPKDTAEIPSDFTFFAYNQLGISKNISCVNDGMMAVPGVVLTADEKKDLVASCAVASVGDDADAEAVFVDANTKIDQIHTKGSVKLNVDASVAATYVYDAGAQVVRESEDESETVTAPRVFRYSESRWNWNPSVKLTDVEFGDKVVVVEDGDTLEIKDGDKFAEVTVKEGGTLVLADGEMFIGTINMAYGSKFDIRNENYATVLHLNGKSYFYGDNARIATGRDMDRYRAAASLKVYQHSDETIYIDMDWLGTIVAPKGRVALGIQRGCKIVAGQFLANVIQVHYVQDVYHVAFAPHAKPEVTTPEEDVKDTTETPEEDIKDTTETPEAIANREIAVRGGLKIVSANKNELMFEAAYAAPYQVMIAKIDGSHVVKFSSEMAREGVNKVSLANANLSRGRYLVTVKQGGALKAQMLAIK